MRSNGPPERRRSDAGKPGGWAQWIAPSLASVQGWTVDKPRSRFADSQGRMPVERRLGVAFSLVTLLLATQEKVTRSLEASEKRQGCRAPKERASKVQTQWMVGPKAGETSVQPAPERRDLGAAHQSGSRNESASCQSKSNDVIKR